MRAALSRVGTPYHGPMGSFETLDFVYMPSPDVARDVQYFTGVLGGRLVFAVEAMGTRVAAVELSAGAPMLLLAGHLEGEVPVLVYRVADLTDELARMAKRGWEREATFEIPDGPCCSFRAPGGQRIALYQRTRPGASVSFHGRRDF